MTTISFPNPLGGERRHWSWRGHDVAYVKRGEGPAMLLVHSVHACAWSMEWRTIVGPLAERFSTYSLDLLGFGASAHPVMEFSSELYVALLTDFLLEVVREPAVLVGSSLGAAYCIAVASRNPALARAVCAIGPAGVARLDTRPGRLNGLVYSAFSSGFGGTLFSGLTSKAAIRFFLKDIYFDKAAMTDEVVDLYWQAARQPNARFGPAAFVGFRLNLDIRAELAQLACPLMLAWGENAKQTPLREAPAYQALKPDAAFVKLPGGDLPHEEQPQAFVPALLGFLDALPGAAPHAKMRG